MKKGRKTPRKTRKRKSRKKTKEKLSHERIAQRSQEGIAPEVWEKIGKALDRMILEEILQGMGSISPRFGSAPPLHSHQTTQVWLGGIDRSLLITKLPEANTPILRSVPVLDEE